MPPTTQVAELIEFARDRGVMLSSDGPRTTSSRSSRRWCSSGPTWTPSSRFSRTASPITPRTTSRKITFPVMSRAEDPAHWSPGVIVAMIGV